jgi:hypothetical protein
VIAASPAPRTPAQCPLNLAHDYTAQLIGEESTQDADKQARATWHLELLAATGDATYSRLETWIEKGTFRPVKSKFYSDSGCLLKIAYYRRYEAHLGDDRPTETIIVDAHLFTKISYQDFRAEDIKDAWFQRDSLPRFSGVMRASVALAAVAATWASAVPLLAADDVDLIPKGVLDEPPALAPPPRENAEGSVPAPPPSRLNSKLFLADALTLSALDDVAVPYPSPLPPRWQDRVSFDAVLQWKPRPPLTLALSDRLNVFA